ncbi:3-oxoacyl-ACP reductase [Lentzea sp. DG1S-22]|uniref:3-oxoacyl-ACP reductase n=1 Tax=Lentzea sp. DG1S-22 TaxID=3108822 RepID=UPI002E773EAF|nr:3-oxoacyl-ACP reductase [Lentzea sp. DG1S-22]WVH79013.1 3-oxoacyl-ACP reductase [Lentzea sp. DG1S-22]
MDRYQKFATSGLGRQLVRRLGLPNPHPLRRDAALATPVFVGGASRLPFLKQLETGAAPYGALVFDASEISTVADLRRLHDFFHPVITQLGSCGRVVVIGRSPDSVAQRALEGFVRSVGKELRKGGTANLVYVHDGAEEGVESTLRFLLSGRSAYVSGQVIHVSGNSPTGTLRGKVALVTGASRGIGEAIAATLARDGAHVVCLDVPAAGEDLSKVANAIGGSALQLDITGDPAKLTSYLLERHGGVDVVVHNAGITRDKTLARMDADKWDAVLEVNLACQERVNDALLHGGVLRPGGRIVGVSSIAGIAGNVGQTNYATSKAGVIGMVQTLAPVLASRGATINAVAPGFIETKMTAAVPFATREVGRRMNSLSQGGLPVDVAETVAWFASPGSGGVNGNVVRVCGQMLLGA